MEERLQLNVGFEDRGCEEDGRIAGNFLGLCTDMSEKGDSSDGGRRLTSIDAAKKSGGRGLLLLRRRSGLWRFYPACDMVVESSSCQRVELFKDVEDALFGGELVVFGF
jgi:hypothetical protein